MSDNKSIEFNAWIEKQIKRIEIALEIKSGDLTKPMDKEGKI